MSKKPLALHDARHAVVIPAGSPDRIPEAAETVRRAGIRLLYHGWPGMTRATDGTILVSASEGVLHVDPFRREVLVRSADNGNTWTDPEVFFDSITDDRDIALNCLSDGTIVATWFGSDMWTRPPPFTYMRPEWESLRAQAKPDTLRALARGWLRRSTDGGRTWERLIHPTLVGQHAGPTVLQNGHLLYCGPYAVEDGSKMVATLSKDGGLTWSIISELPVPRYYDEVTQGHWSVLNENHVLETTSGHLLMACRGTPGHTSNNIHILRSANGGHTWSDPQDLGLLGHPPYLLRLRSGAILCVYSRRSTGSTPKSICGVLSYDDGMTWDREHLLTIRECPSTEASDMGYPVAIETTPGEVFCIYYCVPSPQSPSYAKIDTTQWGILSTRFQLS